MSYRGLFLPVVLLLGATFAGCGRSSPAELTLRVAAPRMPQAMRRARGDAALPDSVEIRLPGVWFDAPRDLTVIARDSADLSAPLSASQAAYSAFKRSDPAWIMASFAEGDREEIAKLLGDPEIREGNRQYYQRIQSKQVEGWAQYRVDARDYRFVFVRLRHSSSTTRVETFIQEQGEWRRTNQLSSDTVFLMAWRAYRFGSITER